MRYGTLLRRMRSVASTGGVIRTTFRGAGSIVGDSTLGSSVEARAPSMATRLTPPMVSSLPPVFVPQFVGRRSVWPITRRDQIGRGGVRTYWRGMASWLVGAGTAIDEEELAGHEPGLRRGEVDDRAGDVLRGAKTSERRAGDLHIAKAWVLAHPLAGQVGLDETRTDRVDGDAARRELQREGFRQRHDAAFGRAVRDALDPAEHSVDRCDVDHSTAVGEQRKSGLRHERDALEVRVDDRVPGVLIERGEIGRDIRPRVIDEDVYRRPLARQRLEAHADRRGAAHVQTERDRATSLRPDLARDRLGVAGLPRCDSDVRARGGKSDRDRAADAAASAGDQRTLAVQVERASHSAWQDTFDADGRGRDPRTGK